MSSGFIGLIFKAVMYKISAKEDAPVARGIRLDSYCVFGDTKSSSSSRLNARRISWPQKGLLIIITMIIDRLKPTLRSDVKTFYSFVHEFRKRINKNTRKCVQNLMFTTRCGIQGAAMQ